MGTKSENIYRQDSCWNRALAAEPIFILLGRDSSAPGAIRAWVSARIASGKNKMEDAQIQEALQCAHEMESYYYAYHRSA